MGDTDLAVLTTIWEERGIRISELTIAEDGTILDSKPPPVTDEIFVPKLLVDAGAGAHLEVGRTLGEGGMGIVRQAVQVPLDRTVAVKSLRPQADRPGGAQELVREARVTGALQHPNIVPIHALGLDEHNRPMLVMKQIDGVPWSTYIADPKHSTRPYPDREPLDFHLDVMLDVCNAVAFAHSKGVVHRDLKPENVMIGRFGEVYVLDWGLAVAVDESLARRMPLAKDITMLAGTPQYMAPEMAAARGDEIGPRTDVYLLGAVLHEIVTGRHRHGASDVKAALLQAYQSRPVDYDGSVPRELAAICNKATHIDVEQRFESVEAFRQALVDFREHRVSESLAIEARSRRAALEARAESATPSERAEVRAIFAECRFAYRQALREWPENDEAARGLERSLMRMAELELDWGRADAAAVLLGAMKDPPADLYERVGEVRRRRAVLEELEKDLDLDVGRRTRAFAALLMGSIFFVIPISTGFAVRRGWFEFDYTVFTIVNVIFAGVSFAFLAWAWDTLNRTRVNRRIVASMDVMVAAMVLLPLGTRPLGLSALQALPLICLISSITVGVMAASIDRRLSIPAIIHMVGFVVGATWNEIVFEAVGFSILISGLYIAHIWRPEAVFPPADDGV